MGWMVSGKYLKAVIVLRKSNCAVGFRGTFEFGSCYYIVKEMVLKQLAIVKYVHKCCLV